MQKQPIPLTDEQKIAHLEKQLRKLIVENKQLKEQLALYQTQETIIEQNIEHSTIEKKIGGRPPKVTNETIELIHDLHAKNYSIRQIAKELNLQVVPVYVRELSKEEAVINFVDCNLSREKILPSEKARAYKMKHDAIKKQGARTDLTSSQVGTKFRSDEKLAETMPDSRMQIQRYIRLNNLILS